MTKNDVPLFVVRATAPSIEAAHTFEELVLLFQDMAEATAYTVLHDRALAEDEAQDAFLVAWLNPERRDAHASPSCIDWRLFTLCGD